MIVTAVTVTVHLCWQRNGSNTFNSDMCPAPIRQEGSKHTDLCLLNVIHVCHTMLLRFPLNPFLRLTQLAITKQNHENPARASYHHACTRNAAQLHPFVCLTGVSSRMSRTFRGGSGPFSFVRAWSERESGPVADPQRPSFQSSRRVFKPELAMANARRTGDP